tara:strand:+ start:10621 stop:11286 length:666 start_codon:yes stop_codon:yes gene_type:complete
LRQIVLDTETTGLDLSNEHRVIEIAAVELQDRKLTGKEYQVYLNPERRVGDSENIHNLSDEFLSDKKLFREIYKEFLDFIKDSELLIHNAEFDVGFLNNELKLAGLNIKIENQVVKITDTLSLAREKHPGQRNSLDALTDRYEIKGYDRSYHGALIDSKILSEVYLLMTGGQKSLGLEESRSVDKMTDEEGLGENYTLLEIKANNEDIKLHEEYLKKIRGN